MGGNVQRKIFKNKFCLGYFALRTIRQRRFAVRVEPFGNCRHQKVEDVASALQRLQNVIVFWEKL